ncbi:MAG: class I SAM-dependent methyltransferase [Ferruginibacter sp.]
MHSPLTLAKKYFHFFLHASNGNGHGVHSPFVFNFIQQVKNKRPDEDIVSIEQVRKKLLSDKSFIEVEDFGAGSTVIKTSKRMISKMAASSLKKKKYSQLLFNMVKFYKAGNILELGTSFGITTAYLAKANPLAKIITIEGAPTIASLAQQNFELLQLNNIEILTGDFNKKLPVALEKMPIVDLAFIDGNHRKKPTLEYFFTLLDHSNSSSVLVFDDIHWSDEMEVAWAEIKNHPGVTLTIDLFFLGIVFFKNDFHHKQHFSIRF